MPPHSGASNRRREKKDEKEEKNERGQLAAGLGDAGAGKEFRGGWLQVIRSEMQMHRHRVAVRRVPSVFSVSSGVQGCLGGWRHWVARPPWSRGLPGAEVVGCGGLWVGCMVGDLRGASCELAFAAPHWVSRQDIESGGDFESTRFLLAFCLTDKCTQHLQQGRIPPQSTTTPAPSKQRFRWRIPGFNGQ